jgi:hypothetical protein
MAHKMAPPVLVDSEGNKLEYKPGEYLVLQSRVVITSTISPNGTRRELEYWHMEYVVERED